VIQIGVYVLQVAFFAGMLWAFLKQVRKDLNGLGIAMRANKAQAERRWLHMIAAQIETSENLDEAKQHAKLLREEAWRG
jgi:hypothetical protein